MVQKYTKVLSFKVCDLINHFTDCFLECLVRNYINLCTTLPFKILRMIYSKSYVQKVKYSFVY